MRLEPLPDAQICIYERSSTVVLTRRVNGAWRSYPVAPEGVAQALAGLPLFSGLLPPDTLGWGMAHGEAFYVRYLPPRPVDLAVELSGSRRIFRFQTPPLVWAGRGTDYLLWALAVPERPTRDDVLLYRAPFPNSYESGAICWGSADRPPVAAAETMEAALGCFMGSNFSMHVDNEKSRKYPATVVALWKELKPETPYPLDDLVPAGRYTLGWLLAGGPWGGAR